MNGETAVLENGLRLSVDWLSFTILSDLTFYDVVALMGYDAIDFMALPKGSRGYLSCHRHVTQNISILSDGRDDMGIHVEISGSSVADVLAHFRRIHSEPTPFGDDAYLMEDFNSSVLLDFLQKIEWNGSVTRLDLAVDDLGTSFFTVDELKQLFDSDCVVSKFRNFKYMSDTKIGGDCTGKTLYVGSRQSDIMIRIYDKQLETNKKNASVGREPFALPWVRWELEIKGDRAKEAVSSLASGISLSALCIGVLSNYLRIIVNDNTRKARCSSSPKWESFLNGIKKLRLFCKNEPRTLDDMKENVKRQYAPTLATIIACEDGDTSFLSELLADGINRLNSRQAEMIAQHQRVAI